MFDDWQSVVANPSIRRLGDIRSWLTPESGTTAGRPLLNFCFALSYAMGGASVVGYHAFNVGIHVVNALLLFGLIRRTVPFGLGFAAIAAALWAAHPLNTSAVSYISQRAESLMAFWLLLLLYALSRRCLAAAVIAGWCGMATKETMVTAPVVALMYDAAFLSGSIRGAVRARQGFYVGLASSWVLLAALMIAFPIADRAVGFAGVSALRSAATEAGAVLHYLRLAFWPHPLVFDYGPNVWAPASAAAAGKVVVVLMLVAAAGWAWIRSPKIGFLPAAFFVLLAPTSSVVPIILQPIAENRMYLPLALVILGVAALVRPLARAAAAPVLLALLALTMLRNETYASATRLWRATVADAPSNPRAYDSLGTVLAAAGHGAEARTEFEQALRIDPAYAPAHYNLGVVLLNNHHAAAAAPHLARALEAPQHRAESRLYLGQALLELGRFADAVPPLTAAAAMLPGSTEAHFDLANALFGADRPAEAVHEYERALALAPGNPTIMDYLRKARAGAAR